MKDYTPLVNGFGLDPNAGGEAIGLGAFINQAFTLFIGLLGIMAVLWIVIGGFQYVSSDAWSTKDSGKKRIQAALGGLILALLSYVILNTIDPGLTTFDFSVRKIEGLRAPQSALTVDGVAVEDSSEALDLGTGSDSGGGGLNSPPPGTGDFDTCAGLDDFRSSGPQGASDKGGSSGSVTPEVAWLMTVVPQKFSGLQVMSSYRSPLYNLTNAYGVSSNLANQILSDYRSGQSVDALVAKYGIKRAALTSNHTKGRAVDFAGPGLQSGQADQLQTWARSNPCLRFSEALWRTSGHFDHIHLAI